ncbi:MAG: glycerol-3-phosphate 1-O-acyltransferase PlsY [Candidatus Methylophosphatis roskildensis]
MSLLLFVVVAYVIGSVPFAVVVSRVFGLADPRSFGSGNPGATNVLRTGNKLAALLTLIGDAAKGAFAVWLARSLGPQWFDNATVPLVVALVGLAALVGHVFPIFLGFKGGKGVATAAGVVLALNPWLGLGTLLAWLVVAVLTRYSSLASVCAGLFAPLAAIWVIGFRVEILGIVAMSAILTWRHMGNIQRLLAGTEGRIGEKKAPVSPAQ